MAEKGLGRGLGALLGNSALDNSDGGSLMLPITKVEPRSNQPRSNFDEQSLGELAESIKLHGILQPLTVRQLPSGRYQIIAGERRWRAGRMAGLSDVPVIIIEADDKKAMELALVENLQREDLNPLEEAAGFKALVDEYGLTQEETAVRTGRSRPAVTNALRLLSLPKYVKDYLEEGSLSAGHARALLALKSQDDQELAAQRILEKELSVRQTEALVKALLTTKEEKEKTHEINYLEEIENSLSSRLGRRIKITSGRKKGRLELEFYGEEDMEALISALSRLGGDL